MVILSCRSDNPNSFFLAFQYPLTLKSFRRRAGIEPIIGHVKADFAMERNYLKGEIGDAHQRDSSRKCIEFQELDKERGWKTNFCPKLSKMELDNLVIKEVYRRLED